MGAVSVIMHLFARPICFTIVSHSGSSTTASVVNGVDHGSTSDSGGVSQRSNRLSLGLDCLEPLMTTSGTISALAILLVAAPQVALGGVARRESGRKRKEPC